ncbi:MAG TPA: hypothetical protein DDW27_00235 [Bacteroidales bacterium]|nr:hypothetical protein [Bacteroidales bacterium]
MSFETLALEDTLLSILIRFGVNMTVIFVLIRLIYYRFTRKEEYVFSFFMIGIIIFLLCSLLETVNIQLGMALGLFAIFAILRFRTVNFSAKDMTYIFTVIGVSVINSQANIPPPVIGAIVINSIIIITAIILEVFLNKRTLSTVTIIFNKLDLLQPQYRKELLKELSRQTGQEIKKVTIRRIDLNKGNAELEGFFKDHINSDKGKTILSKDF